MVLVACLAEATNRVELLLATANRGKIAELRSLCEPTSITVHSIGDPHIPELDVDETGSTFAENAELKARAFANATGLPVIADDSGLEVEALGGAPGVKSARWVSGTDEDRNKALLQKLQNETNRKARFVTVVCYMESPDSNPLFFEGSISGTISTTMVGSEGFGYDPIFIPDGFTKTFAELGTEVKNELSHRAQAFAKVLTHLQGT